MATGSIYELVALGIDLPRMIFYTFAINAVLACAAALLVTPTYLAKFDMDRCTHCAEAERRGVRITELAVAGTRRPCDKYTLSKSNTGRFDILCIQYRPSSTSIMHS